MNTTTTPTEAPRAGKIDPEKAYGSNAIRLTALQWIVVAVLFGAFYFAAPILWQRVEPLETTSSYRIPYDLSEDYWLYKRYAGTVAEAAGTIPLVGDSVIWGQYATPEDALPQQLNRAAGTDRFANLGVNGTHPAALGGLLKYYGGAFRDQKVVLQYNPLWMTSKRRDLQIEKPTRFNHPALAPQFFPKIPCYEASFAGRLSIAMTRFLPFLQWTGHVRKTYFDNESLPAWTMKHPGENPLGAITLQLPPPEAKAPSDPVPWMEKESRLQSFEWVSPESSLQWRFFQDSLALLQSRGNEVFVLFGPFNEHLMTPKSRDEFIAIKQEMIAWLRERQVRFIAPDPLPSELYADASHPIAAGYALLAQQMMNTPEFREFMGG